MYDKGACKSAFWLHLKVCAVVEEPLAERDIPTRCRPYGSVAACARATAWRWQGWQTDDVNNEDDETRNLVQKQWNSQVAAALTPIKHRTCVALHLHIKVELCDKVFHNGQAPAPH